MTIIQLPPQFRFIVAGSRYDQEAMLHIVASSPEDAIHKWMATFDPDVRTGMSVHATNIDTDRPDLSQDWKGHGYQHQIPTS